jgi:flagella basal body P-ring formation protein FlgA
MKTGAILIILVALVAGWAHAACVAVPSDQILARDLSPVLPLFGALDPDAIIGYSPFPGTQRVLSPHDLLLTARRYGVAFPPGDPIPTLCVERMVRSLSLEEVRAALLAAVDSRAHSDISLEILDFSNKPVPVGRLVFQLATLNRPSGNNPQTPVIWSGRLIYGDQHSLSVWAKVRISVDREVLLATETIPKGEVIRAGQITSTVLPQFPWPEPPPSSFAGAPVSEIVGKVARRMILAGQRIAPEALENPKDVMQGETVHVKVVDGAATITLDAVAQSSGIKGATILVHNPSSGKSFRAVIEDRGRVIVVPAPGSTPPSAPGSSL